MVNLLRLMFWTAVIVTLYLASVPQPLAIFSSDKSEHQLAFAVLSLLALTAFPRAPRWWLMLGLAGLGGAIEIIQLNPALRRQADITDWFADLKAIAVVFTLWWGAGRLLRRQA
jgi:hypothetical protein